MKKEQGFTLTELLAVTLILGLLATVIFVGVNNLSAKAKTNMFCTKVKAIEEAAILWGNDRIKNGNTLITLEVGQSYKTAPVVPIQDLIDLKYIKNADTEDGALIDPRNKSTMNKLSVYVYMRNNRVNAKLTDTDSVCE